MAAVSEVINNATTVIKFVAVTNRTAVPAAGTLLELKGANTASTTGGIQTVDISSFGDGLRMPKLKVGIDETLSVNGIKTKDAAFAAFKSLATGADARKECYMEITYGDGSKTAFYAMVSDYGEELAQRDVLKFSSTVTIQSDPTFTAAPI